MTVSVLPASTCTRQTLHNLHIDFVLASLLSCVICAGRTAFHRSYEAVSSGDFFNNRSVHTYKCRNGLIFYFPRFPHLHLDVDQQHLQSSWQKQDSS